VPAEPVTGIDGLVLANAGTLTAVQDGAVITATLPIAIAGSWVYLYVYTATGAVPVGWIQADADGRVRVDLSGLPVGDHKLAVLDAAGALLGWVSAVVDGDPAPAAVVEDTPDAVAEAPAASSAPSASPSPEATASTGWTSADWWLLAGGAAVGMILAAGVTLLIRRPRRLPTGR
jgi:hypothetical protein